MEADEACLPHQAKCIQAEIAPYTASCGRNLQMRIQKIRDNKARKPSKAVCSLPSSYLESIRMNRCDAMMRHRRSQTKRTHQFYERFPMVPSFHNIHERIGQKLTGLPGGSHDFSQSMSPLKALSVKVLYEPTYVHACCTQRFFHTYCGNVSLALLRENLSSCRKKLRQGVHGLAVMK